ncbi:MAG: hypothetical protein K2W96_04795, partial [Gemmataceae bacterium]|nr:hypothetical protein [Gemmataceae bacterium]
MPASNQGTTAVPRLTLLLAALAALAAAPPGPLPSQVKAWVEQLGDDSFEKREEASRRLRAAGERAEAELERAEQAGDAEVKRRVRAILADFRLGIYPDTPGKVADLARKYGTLAGSEKRPVLQGLMAAGAPGIRSLARLLKTETDPVARKEVYADLARSASRAIPGLLEKGDPASVEALLELGVQGDPATGAPHYAAYWLLTGRVDQAAARVEARLKAKPEKADHEVLFWLRRAAGDFSRARRAAINAERLDLLEGLLFEHGKWKELDADPKLVPEGMPVVQKGFRAAYARLAGNAKAHQQAVDDLLEKARAVAKDKGDLLPYAKALFFNGKASEAVDLLSSAEAEPRLLFEVLAAQLRYREAFSAADTAAGKPDAADPRMMHVLKARHQWLLGLTEEAAELLKKAAADVKDNVGAAWTGELVETELVIGRRDEAWKHAAAILASKDDGAAHRVLGKLALGQEAEALALWHVVRHMKGEAALLRAFLEGKATAEQGRALLKAAGEAPFVSDQESEKASRWLAVGSALAGCRQDKLAAEALAKGGVRGRVRLGDLRLKAKDHRRAFEEYDAAYRTAIAREENVEGDEAQPSVALWLSGKALVALGRKKEAEARMERAHLLPLGDAEGRHAFLKVLTRRKETGAAKREAELLSRLGDPVVTSHANYWTSEGLRNLSLLRERSKEELKASDGFEAVFLGCLTPGVNFTRPQAYVTVPGYLRKLRAVGLAREGRWAESRVLAAQA